MNMNKIYTDGACSIQTLGRPGGWGAYLEIDNDTYSFSGSRKETTNQQMEIEACVRGIEELEKIGFNSFFPIEIYSDSAYVCNCFKQNWWINWEKNGWVNSKKEPVANKELWEELIKLYRKYTIEFIKVKGHSGNPGNEKANDLAQAAAQKIKKEALC